MFSNLLIPALLMGELVSLLTFKKVGHFGFHGASCRVGFLFISKKLFQLELLQANLIQFLLERVG